MTLPKLAWVLAPLLLYGLFCAILVMRGRALSRMALNVHTSLLLLAYLLCTAGLGIFWVANQQLPVFDWHYLFGYATLLLVSLHLVFNLPLVVRWFARRRAAVAPGKRVPALGKIAAIGCALGAAYYVGTRQSDAPMPVASSAARQDPVALYHAYSSESRLSVFQRAPGVAWGGVPPPFKTYQGAPQVVLQKGGPEHLSLGEVLAGPATGPQPLTIAALGRVLYLSSGITLERGGRALRAAPSSGALFPSELYVVARKVAGLAAGVYHYDPRRHQLARLGPLPASTGAPQADDADALVMLSAVFRRTGYKYHNRAYRYALADAGHLLENTRLAAHGAGWRASLLSEFDDRAANAALAIDGIEEAVLALMALRAQADIGAPAALLPAFEFGPVPSAAPTAIGVTGMVHQATSLQLLASGAGIVLPPPAPARAELFRTIVERRSARRFSDAPLALEQLSGVLADLRQKPQLYRGVQVTVVVNRVTGLPAGVYRYRAPHALHLVRAGLQAQRAQSAALSQDVIGDAAAVLILSVEREHVLAGGARAYRHALLETGMAGERWLLGAVARNLAACPVGAFYDDEAAALIGEDGTRHWVLHFAALGAPG